MKIFLSWSGDRSKKLAECFKDWLPNVLQHIEPYFSQKDIQLGERWGNNLEQTLDEYNFGLVFITPENINSTWVNFEAGALSKNLKSRLIPMLWQADLTILNSGPLRQFQSTKEFDKNNINELVLLLNSHSEENKLDEARVNLSFEKWWPDLETKLSCIPETTEKIEQPTQQDVLEAVMQEITKNNKLLENGIRRSSKNYGISPALVRDLNSIRNKIRDTIILLQSIDSEDLSGDLSILYKSIEELILVEKNLNKPLEYLRERSQIRNS